MRKLTSLALMVCLSSLAGCSLYDQMFDVFGRHYTAGGANQYEKKWEYDRQVERWQGHDPDFATK